MDTEKLTDAETMYIFKKILKRISLVLQPYYKQIEACNTIDDLLVIIREHGAKGNGGENISLNMMIMEFPYELERFNKERI